MIVSSGLSPTTFENLLVRQSPLMPRWKTMRTNCCNKVKLGIKTVLCAGADADLSHHATQRWGWTCVAHESHEFSTSPHSLWSTIHTLNIVDCASFWSAEGVVVVSKDQVAQKLRERGKTNRLRCLLRHSNPPRPPAPFPKTDRDTR